MKVITRFLSQTTSKGYSLIELLIVISVIAAIYLVAKPTYTHFQQNIEKKAHIANASKIQYASLHAILEKKITLPEPNTHINITLETLNNLNYLNDLIDPSSHDNRGYNPLSVIQIHNKDPKTEFYITLQSENNSHIYINSIQDNTQDAQKKITDLQSSDIHLFNAP
ncbi:MAG: hypothetical protein CL521_02925 [Actinobacteria bacterium]|nr:hypothetical protein [Actinomycetota bacterium]|tara:strand:+ start:134 stop:634 length:501 start_codon:yes stop_codon:yes gene_type:complete